MRKLYGTLAQGLGLWVALVNCAWALPSLQLGPDTSGGSWEYNTGDQTWYTGDTGFTLSAYANALQADGGNGDYAFDSGNTDRTAYLVFSAVPSTLSTTPFVLSVTGDSGPLTLVQEGYGSPPDAGGKDNNDLAPHSIYDTYFYIYEFRFDGALDLIGDTQPGQTGSGMGYSEEFNVLVNSMEPGIGGVHMDLFTVAGDGKLQTTSSGGSLLPAGDLTNQLFAFAPFSHDAQYSIPEPGMLSLMLLGGLGFGWRRWAAARR